MSSFKAGIPQALMIEAFHQINNYLWASNSFSDLPPIVPDRYSAEALFGGEGLWWDEDDTTALRVKLSVLADNVSIQSFRITKGSAVVFMGAPKVKDPAEVTSKVFGYDDLFQELAPELL